jgi:hypothetical protein
MIRQVSRYSDGFWTAEKSGFDSRQRQEIFLFSTASRPPLGSPSLLQNGYWGLFPYG